MIFKIAVWVVLLLVILSWSAIKVFSMIKKFKKFNKDVDEGKSVLTYSNLFFFFSLYATITFASIQLNMPLIERIGAYATLFLFLSLIILDFLLAKRNNFKYFK